jgi:hypothetical protein
MKAILAALLTLTACTPAGAQESVEMPQAFHRRHAARRKNTHRYPHPDVGLTVEDFDWDSADDRQTKCYEIKQPTACARWRPALTGAPDT